MDDFIPYFGPTDPPDEPLKPFNFGDDLCGGEMEDEFSEGQSIPDEDLYDAINDETFGACITTTTTNDDDLAHFSIRTANLALFDDELRGSNNALEPPDPSHIPIPQIGNDQDLMFSDHRKPLRNLKKSADILPPGTVSQVSSSIWDSGSFNGIGSLSELYMGQQLKSESRKQHHNQHFELIDQLPMFPSVIGPPPGLELIKPVPKSPAAQQQQRRIKSNEKDRSAKMNAEELERKLLAEAALGSKKITQHPTALSTLVDSAVLEREMFEEATKQRQQQQLAAAAAQMVVIQQQKQAAMAQAMMEMAVAQAAAAQNTAPLTSPPTWYQQLPLKSGGIPPVAPPSPGQIPPVPLPEQMPTGLSPPPHLLKHWQQQIQQVFAAAAAAGAGMLPPPQHEMTPPPPAYFFPPPPAGMVSNRGGDQHMLHPLALLQCRDGPRVLPPPPPPFPGHMPPMPAGYGQGIGVVNDQHFPALGSSPAMPGIPPQLQLVPASLNPRVERLQRNQRMNPALPSGKTIADYALDPYAGLMSTKEREWLIKIHLIQCLGTGDPMEDDFYYTVWKQKNVLAKASGEGTSEAPRYYKFEATFPATAYNAPSFMGALGKPVHSSSRIPRQIIEVINESLEEESINGNGAGSGIGATGKLTAAHRQKRLRTMLMKIENASLMLIDCRDIRRKLRFFDETCITDYIDKNEITDRIARYAENLTHVESAIFSPEQLPTVMLIQKGRQLVYNWFHFLHADEGAAANAQQKLLTLMRTLLDGMAKWARKVPEEELEAYAEGFCFLFSKISSKAELFGLLQTMELDPAIIQDSKLIQLTLLSLLAALIPSAQQQKESPLQHIEQLLETAIGQLLFGPKIASSLKIQPDKAGDLRLFNANKWARIREWLAIVGREKQFPGGSVAERISKQSGVAMEEVERD